VTGISNQHSSCSAIPLAASLPSRITMNAMQSSVIDKGPTLENSGDATITPFVTALAALQNIG
jgi:hypothetical protein